MIVNKQIIIREFGKIREGRRGGRQTERGVPERERQAGEATLVRVFSRGGRKTPALSGIAEGNAPKSTATGTARFTKSSRRIPIRGHSSDPTVRSTFVLTTRHRYSSPSMTIVSRLPRRADCREARRRSGPSRASRKSATRRWPRRSTTCTSWRSLQDGRILLQGVAAGSNVSERDRGV